ASLRAGTTIDTIGATSAPGDANEDRRGRRSSISGMISSIATHGTDISNWSPFGISTGPRRHRCSEARAHLHTPALRRLAGHRGRRLPCGHELDRMACGIPHPRAYHLPELVLARGALAQRARAHRHVP